LLVPFAVCTPLACSDYYETSAPSTTLGRQRTCPPPDRIVRREGDRGWFPRSPRIDRWGRRPPWPRQHRHTYAAVLRRDLPTGPV